MQPKKLEAWLPKSFPITSNNDWENRNPRWLDSRIPATALILAPVSRPCFLALCASSLLIIVIIRHQGGAKFAGYEFWKKQFVQIAGDQDTAVKYRTAIYLGASSVAE